MSNVPDLRGLKKGDAFRCGSNLKFTLYAKSVIGRLCFDCGRFFESAKKKSAHVEKTHSSSNENGRAKCEICGYHKASKNAHSIQVRTHNLRVPTEYPIEDMGPHDEGLPSDPELAETEEGEDMDAENI